MDVIYARGKQYKGGRVSKSLGLQELRGMDEAGGDSEQECEECPRPRADDDGRETANLGHLLGGDLRVRTHLVPLQQYPLLP